MERDAAKYWRNSNIRIACFGYENQTMPDIDAPLRGMGYDGSEYRRQMLADYEEITDKDGTKRITRRRKPRYPVITLFLYDYFVQMRKNNCYVAKPETIKHVHELLELMTVLTDDRRFVDVCNNVGKEAVNMCEVLDQIENRGMEKGIGIGMDIIIRLSNILVSAGRIDDLKRAEADRSFLEELIQELLPEER